MNKKDEKIEIVEKENVALRECIGDVLIILSDYDGYREAEGLMGLIDGVVETLNNGYPNRLVDYQDRDVCPLCCQKTGKVNKELWQKKIEMTRDPKWQKMWDEMSDERKQKIREEEAKKYDEYLRYCESMTTEEKEKYQEELEEYRRRYNL